jgi:hypothetical protein
MSDSEFSTLSFLWWGIAIVACLVWCHKQGIWPWATMKLNPDTPLDTQKNRANPTLPNIGIFLLFVFILLSSLRIFLSMFIVQWDMAFRYPPFSLLNLFFEKDGILFEADDEAIFAFCFCFVLAFFIKCLLKRRVYSTIPKDAFPITISSVLGFIGQFIFFLIILGVLTVILPILLVVGLFMLFL